LIISDGRASCFRLPGLRVAGVRAGRQDRPAAQGLAEDVVVLPWDRAGDVRLQGPGGPAADQFGRDGPDRRGPPSLTVTDPAAARAFKRYFPGP